MKKFFKTIIFLAVIAALFYGAYLSFRIIPENSFVIVFDHKNKRVDSVVSSGKKFIYKGLLFKNFSLIPYSSDGGFSSQIRMCIPGLEVLDEVTYDILIPVEISYRLNPKKIRMPADFKSRNFVKDMIEESLTKNFARELSILLKNGYSVELLESGYLNAEEKVFAGSKDFLNRNGIVISQIRINGIVRYPTNELYQSAKAFASEFLKLKNQYKLDVERAMQNIKLRNIELEDYYKELDKMSVVIKNNPAILKYIYIDKMSTGLKFYPPIDYSGYPLNLDETGVQSVPPKGQDIDNLKENIK